MTIKFPKISRKRIIYIDCKVCHKTRKRALVEMQTLNPYNRTAEGIPKTKERILDELWKKLDDVEARLRAEGITCKTCDWQMAETTNAIMGSFKSTPYACDPSVEEEAEARRKWTEKFGTISPFVTELENCDKPKRNRP